MQEQIKTDLNGRLVPGLFIFNRLFKVENIDDMNCLECPLQY